MKPPDLREGNILMSLDGPSELEVFEEAETAEPTPRKMYESHNIYCSGVLQLRPKLPVLCDFGESRFGSELYGGHAIPDLLRAPEILLRIEWDDMGIRAHGVSPIFNALLNSLFD